MSKILLPIYSIQDFGGIINWVEHLCHGLKAIGKQPVLVRLEDKHRIVPSRTTRTTLPGESGLRFDQRAGWVFPTSNRIPLRSTDWRKYTRQFEAVIWVVPVPTASCPVKEWERLYQILTPQVMVIHDGNLPKIYPHAYRVMNRCEAVVGVHDCAYAGIGAEHNRILIPNPQAYRNLPIGYNRRSRRVFSLQTFKRWKRVDDLVRAVPHMSSEVLLAGGGIEYYYMTSKTKRKSIYADIWERATEAGMKFLGYISEAERDQHLSRCRLLLDPSWSKGYAARGSHLNRTFVDAIIAGCLPAARDLLMDGNSFFDRNDYITIPHDDPPQAVAEKLDSAVGMPRLEYERRVERLREVVWEKFDSVRVARRYAELWGA